MTRHSRAGKRLLRMAAGIAFAAGLAAIDVAPVAADCDGPVPSFREHARQATRVVIGKVVAVDLAAPWTDSDGRSSRFTLEVQHVLRGPREPSLTLRDLEYLGCADHIITARPGDQIALALDAIGFSPPMRFNTVAWVDGQPFGEGVERITVREAYLLLGVPLPEEQVPPAATSDRPIPLAVLALVPLAAVVTVVAFRGGRSRRRRP